MLTAEKSNVLRICFISFTIFSVINKPHFSHVYYTINSHLDILNFFIRSIIHLSLGYFFQISKRVKNLSVPFFPFFKKKLFYSNSYWLIFRPATRLLFWLPFTFIPCLIDWFLDPIFSIFLVKEKYYWCIHSGRVCGG